MKLSKIIEVQGIKFKTSKKIENKDRNLIYFIDLFLYRF
jgi:hypothetical protein